MTSYKEILTSCLTDEDKDKKRELLIKTLLYVTLALLTFFFIFYSYIIFKPLNETYSSSSGWIVKVYSLSLIAVVTIIAFVLYFKKKLNFSNIVILLLVLGLILRVMYMLYTSKYTRQHDTWSSNNDGHYDYTLYIYQYNTLRTLPFTENIYQFYHPPLNYFIQAYFMHYFKAVCSDASLTNSTENLYGACQILSCYYMFIVSIYSVKTILLTKCNERTKLFTIAFAVLFPRLIQFSGQLNNDPISTLFTILSIYRLTKWYLKDKSLLNISLSALYLGLAMMSKLSAVIPILGYGVIFLLELIKTLRKKEDHLPLSKMCIQYLSFLLIIIPLGFWYQIFANKVMGMPYNYVFRNLNSNLFTGYRGYILNNSDIYKVTYFDTYNSGPIYTNKFYNFFMRFISPFYVDDYLANTVYCNAFENYNILTYAIRSSIMGEFSYPSGGIFAFISTISGYIIFFSLLVSIIYLLVKKRLKDKEFYLPLSLFISMVFFYLYLQVKMPWGCSMDFRYIVPILLPISMLFCYTNETNKDINTTVSKSLNIISIGSLLLFSVSSSLFYYVTI